MFSGWGSGNRNRNKKLEVAGIGKRNKRFGTF